MLCVPFSRIRSETPYVVSYNGFRGPCHSTCSPSLGEDLALSGGADISYATVGRANRPELFTSLWNRCRLSY